MQLSTLLFLFLLLPGQHVCTTCHSVSTDSTDCVGLNLPSDVLYPTRFVLGAWVAGRAGAGKPKAATQ